SSGRRIRSSRSRWPFSTRLTARGSPSKRLPPRTRAAGWCRARWRWSKKRPTRLSPRRPDLKSSRGGATTTRSSAFCAAPELLLLPGLGALGARVGAAPPFARSGAVRLHVHDHDDRAAVGNAAGEQLAALNLADRDVFAAIPFEFERAVLVHRDVERALAIIFQAVGFR